MTKALDILEDTQMIAAAIQDCSILLSASSENPVGANLLHILSRDLTESLDLLEKQIRI